MAQVGCVNECNWPFLRQAKFDALVCTYVGGALVVWPGDVAQIDSVVLINAAESALP